MYVFCVFHQPSQPASTKQNVNVAAAGFVREFLFTYARWFAVGLLLPKLNEYITEGRTRTHENTARELIHKRNNETVWKTDRCRIYIYKYTYILMYIYIYLVY